MTDSMRLDSEELKKLLQIVKNIEINEEKISSLKEENRETFKFASSTGFDVGVIRKVLRRRKMNKEQKEMQDYNEELVQIYEDKIQELETEVMVNSSTDSINNPKEISE